MITCRKLIKFLDDYVEGDLPEPIRKRFESHIEACASCREYLQTYRKTIELERQALRCQGAPSPEPMPEALVQAILRACREADQSDASGSDP